MKTIRKNKNIKDKRAIVKDKSISLERANINDKNSLNERLLPEKIARPLFKLFYDIQKLRIQTSIRITNPLAQLTDSERLILDEHLLALQKQEEQIKHDLAGLVEIHPLYIQYLSKIKGIGIILSAGLLFGGIDIQKATTVSKMWRFCGLGVMPAISKDENREIERATRNDKNIEAERFPFIAERRVKGQKLHYSSFMKITIWKIADSFNKNRNRSVYGRLLAQMHEKEKQEHGKGCERCNKTKSVNMHQFMRARRRCMKIFLFNVWRRWREIERLPVTEPYIIGKGKHKRIIDPGIDKSERKGL